MSITVIVPTKNEGLHLEACLGSVASWADQVFVVDSFSTDSTEEIARGFADRRVHFVQHAYEGPAAQKNWALDELPIETDWVLFLDADELVGPELRDEILERVAGDPAANGFFLNRRIIWNGKWIRRGGWFPNWNLRLFRRGKARYQMRRVHEHMVVEGETEYLAGHLIHEDLRDLAHSIAKHNRYSDDEALEYLEVQDGEHDAYAKLLTRDRMAQRRWIKTKIWSRLPMKGVLYFLWAYFVRLGFLDGAHGLRYHAMHAIYKHFDEMKLWELRNYKQGAEPGAVHLAETYWERHLAEHGETTVRARRKREAA